MKLLKKLLRIKKKNISINLNELEEFLNNNDNNELNEINKEINNILHKIKRTKAKLIKIVEQLQKTKLRSKNLSERNFVQNSKDGFCHKSLFFYKELVIPEINYQKISDFCKDFEEDFYEYDQHTVKQISVLIDYFPKINEVSKNIKLIENYIVNLYELSQDVSVVKYKTIIAKIIELKKYNKNLSKLNEKINDHEDDLNYTLNQQKKAKDELSELRSRPEYNTVNKNDKIKKEAESEINKIKLKIIKKTRPLLKLEKLTKKDKKLIDDYVNYPLDTLKKDKKFAIYRIGKKKYKKLSKDYFSKILDDYTKLNELRKKSVELLDKSLITMKFKDINYKIDHSIEKIDRLKEEISDIKNTMKHLDVNGKKDKIEKILSNYLKTNIEIKIE